MKLEEVRNKLKRAKTKETPKPVPKEESEDEEFLSSINKERKRKLYDLQIHIFVKLSHSSN